MIDIFGTAQQPQEDAMPKGPWIIEFCSRPAISGDQNPDFGELVSHEIVAIVFAQKNDTVEGEHAKGMAGLLAAKVANIQGDKDMSRVQTMEGHARTDGLVIVCLEKNQAHFPTRKALYHHPGPIQFYLVRPVLNGEVHRLQEKIAG
jgi:hypothetical protein